MRLLISYCGAPALAKLLPKPEHFDAVAILDKGDFSGGRLATTMQQLRKFILTEEGQAILAVVKDGWLQLAVGTLVAMYVIGDLLS
ncbi:hypothetical protein Nham_4246 (plasmid) [Nitrobacter hamburgensis X14]|uniref:Uncharacterized protein n=1 Tax=Nitrobacter hamburgensis (strain DSM 10229 / NCIMB 13809 / X14) TaxID=323097 RepID=Q1QFY8_NITHX|nr:hypothetical protein Nham_4246 [Nitrobacter hamburgensis X14]